MTQNAIPTELSANILADISKHLPQMTSDALQLRLQQADAERKELDKTSDMLDRTAAELRRAKERYEIAESKLQKHKELATREAAVAEAERTLRIKELEFQLAASNENTKFARDIALGLVRNVDYRKTVHNQASNHTNGPSGWNNHETRNESIETSSAT